MERFIVEWLLFIFAAGLIFPFLIGPIQIHQKVRQQARPEVVPFSPDHASLPEEVREYFRQVTDELAALGFEPVDGVALPRQTQGVKTLMLVLVNRTTKITALASVMYAGNSVRRLRNAYVEIVARHRDGTLIQVYNSQELGAFPPRPNARRFQFRMVPEADRLGRIHLAIAEKLGGNSERFLRIDEECNGDTSAYIVAALREELETHVGTGYLWLSEDERVYRLTWKGAFLVTWGLMFPFKQFRRARRDRGARQWLAELEREGVFDR